MTKKLAPAERRAEILAAALDLAKQGGYDRITRDHIAIHAGVATGLVTKYFNTMTQLRRAVMRAAIAGEVLEVIAQGLASGDPHAHRAPDALKRKAVETLMTRV